MEPRESRISAPSFLGIVVGGQPAAWDYSKPFFFWANQLDRHCSPGIFLHDRLHTFFDFYYVLGRPGIFSAVFTYVGQCHRTVRQPTCGFSLGPSTASRQCLSVISSSRSLLYHSEDLLSEVCTWRFHCCSCPTVAPNRPVARVVGGVFW